MRDIALLRVGGNDNQRDTRAKRQRIRLRRSNVIIEPTEIIPGKENGCIGPVLTLADRIDYVGDKILARGQVSRRMIALRRNWRQEGDIGHIASLHIRNELGGVLNVVW